MIKRGRHCRTTYSFIIALALILPALTENVASGATYYVATSGSNSNSCATAQNISTPKGTIASGLACLGAGDTLYIRGGSYVERIHSNSQTIPTGTSWANAPVIAGYPGETATLRPGSGGEVIALAHSYIQYVIFKDLHLDATGVSYGISAGYNGANHIRFQNVEVFNASASGAITSSPGPDNTYIEFLSCHIHHNGSGHFDHGLYLSTNSNLVQGCSIHDNSAYGVHVYIVSGSTNNNTVRDSDIYNNATLDESASGIIFARGDGNIAFNNIVRGNKHGIVADYTATNSKIYNNTIYNNSPGNGITIASASNTTVINNIVWGNSGAISNGGTGTVLQTNLTTNPQFINVAGLDFHPLPISAAINAGTILSAVPTDKDGKTRPQGSAYDIGAYELASADTTPPASPTGLIVK